jgi:hypothetical protein
MIGTGSGRGMALPKQIMTTASSAAMATAGWIIAQRSSN